MLPLSLDVRKSNRLPKAVVGIIFGTWFLHLIALDLNDMAGKRVDAQLLAFRYHDPHLFQFFSSVISHADWDHWFWNMFYLWVFGAALEDRLGWKKFLALFWVCGLGATVLEGALYYSYYWNEPSWPPNAGWGASGAIFGIMGLCQARFVKARVRLLWFPEAFPFFSWQLPVTWLCAYRFCLEISLAGSDDHIGHLAHVAGFLVGLACADFLGIKKESYEELILGQAEAEAERGRWIQAIERYDRLLALHPRNPLYREGRLNCLYRLWPRSGKADSERRQRTLDELQRCLADYFAGGKPADAVRLFRAYVPPFALDELRPTLRQRLEAMRGLYPPEPGRYLKPEEQQIMAARLERALLKAAGAGDQEGAALAAAGLLRCKEIRLWDIKSLQAGAEAMSRQGDLRGAELCERLLKFGDEQQGLGALLLLERLWKGTPKQAGFVGLLKLAAGRFQGLEENLRYQDLKQRLRLV
jgi:membrane associated rhomboid family serine protease